MESRIETGEMRVLVIGSGPVVIGQSAEFDYAGTQACSILKGEGIYTVLINSNPATIQTDESSADRVYIEPINLANAVRIMENERITHIIGSMGGQTALNLVLDLYRNGILQRNNVKILGTSPESIGIAEDRDLFHRVMEENGIAIPWSITLTRTDMEENLLRIPSFPVILRASFSLGGLSGKIVSSASDLRRFLHEIFSDQSQKSVEVEKSLLGLIEMEYEVIRDTEGNSLMVCNMENLDPMGVHTGESIVVTPSLTIPDRLHQKMRHTALKIAEIIGIVGACNVQFAVDQERENFYVIEVNPRTSRSSALASKASGYPIAKVATLVLIGHSLTSIRNPITGNTSAAFEPSMDYVTVKIPIWPHGKFQDSGRIGISMKSTGEAMGIGRSFEESFLKAIVSTELDLSQFFRKMTRNEIIPMLREANWRRIGYILASLNMNLDMDEVCELTGWDHRIATRIKNIFDLLNQSRNNLVENLGELKVAGIPDRVISWITGVSEADLLIMRLKRGILPVYRMIDSSSSEFSSRTRYMYATYAEEDESDGIKEKSILILGSGPNRIGQGLEFDYSTVKAIQALKKTGFSAMIINSNPETVSTDFNTSDELYFDPLTLEYVSGILEKRKPEGIIVQFSGQTGQNMARDLADIYGEDIILGTSASHINKIEQRENFSRDLDALGICQALWSEAHSTGEILEKSVQFNFKVIIRGSFIIGGSSMVTIRSEQQLEQFINGFSESKGKFPLLISELMAGADEYDMDFISDGENVIKVGILKQIEPAGVHSGDSTAICGPGIPEENIEERMIQIASKLAKYYSLKGFVNIQFMEKNGAVYVIELNARASRTIPFISKLSGINWVETGIDVIVGNSLNMEKTGKKEYGAKIPVFPFNRFPDSAYELGVEMRSTGEAMVHSPNLKSLRSGMKEFYSIETKKFLILGDDNIRYREEDVETILSYDEAVEKINNDSGINMVCYLNSEHRKDFCHIAEARKIPLINNEYLWEFLSQS
ncbi:MAG: carbamoyl-phosphate synthase (glutamine-hydrolyzing) large subunit [Cuniculiplasma sp.]